MQCLDDLPYSVFVAFLGAAAFFLGNLVFYQFPWQLVAAPIMGGLLGFVAGVRVVRSKKLPIFATVREHRIAMAGDKQRDERS